MIAHRLLGQRVQVEVHDDLIGKPDLHHTRYGEIVALYQSKSKDGTWPLGKRLSAVVLFEADRGSPRTFGDFELASLVVSAEPQPAPTTPALVTEIASCGCVLTVARHHAGCTLHQPGAGHATITRPPTEAHAPLLVHWAGRDGEGGARCHQRPVDETVTVTGRLSEVTCGDCRALLNLPGASLITRVGPVVEHARSPRSREAWAVLDARGGIHADAGLSIFESKGEALKFRDLTDNELAVVLVHITYLAHAAETAPPPFRVEKRRPCVWCGRKAPRVFSDPSLPWTCGRTDCARAQDEARTELKLSGPLTQAQAAAVQRYVRSSLGLPPPTPAEVPEAEWFEEEILKGRAATPGVKNIQGNLWAVVREDGGIVDHQDRVAIFRREGHALYAANDHHHAAVVPVTVTYHSHADGRTL